ncbi:MAG: hypothetical protein Fur0037_09380 [Planctomycetota bacterium]
MRIMSRECLSFLRGLHEHLAASREGGSREGAIPHVGACPACARRFEVLHRQDALLRGMPRPVPPERLRSPAFFAGILESAVEAFEGSRQGELLEGH